MTIKYLAYITILGLFLTGCGGEVQENSNPEEISKAEMPKDTIEPNQVKESKADVENVKVVDPFPDFPRMATKAKEGDFVLTPAVKIQKNATLKGSGQFSFIFYNAKMIKPGESLSEVDFTFDGSQQIPNYMLVPIPSGEKAQVGDILLTWWQSGSGMQRAIVVKADNPSEPVVRYLDIDLNNPAKNKEGVSLGQMDEAIKPNTFVKIKEAWMPATTIAIKEGSSYKKATVIAVQNEKVLVIGFSGRMKVYEKSNCTPIEIIPKVKPGDKVQIPYVGSFVNGIVKRIDNKIGRVFTEIEWGGQKQEIAVPFGDVTTSLPL